MSFIQMQVAIDESRADLEAAGIRGIDLDYLLDMRVDHRPCLAALEEVVSKELARWLEVRAMCTPEQWAFFEAMEEFDRLEMRTIKKAARELKDAFKRRVLRFYKEAMDREAEKRAAKRLSEGDAMRDEAIEQDLGDLKVHE